MSVGRGMKNINQLIIIYNVCQKYGDISQVLHLIVTRNVMTFISVNIEI